MGVTKGDRKRTEVVGGNVPIAPTGDRTGEKTERACPLKRAGVRGSLVGVGKVGCGTLTTRYIASIRVRKRVPTNV